MILSGNRILIFFSDQAVNILECSFEWCLDGTFKYSPKIFYQILTIIPVYKKEHLPCVFVLFYFYKIISIIFLVINDLFSNK